MTQPHLPSPNSVPTLKRMPVPHALRKALPKWNLAESALENARRGKGYPRLDINRLSCALTSSSGHVVLGAPPNWTDAQLRWAYVVILRHFGELNDRQDALVEAEKQTLDDTASSPSLLDTCTGTGMHAAGNDKEHNPNLEALLCLEPGAVGEKRLLTNAKDILLRMRLTHPELEPIARLSWSLDAVTSGRQDPLLANASNLIPVGAEGEHGFVFRYMRHRTERALSKLDRQVPSELKALFDFLDEDLAAHALGFRLNRGDMLLANNRFMVQGRESFKDQAGSHFRGLLRTWVDGFSNSPGRPLSLRA